MKGLSIISEVLFLAVVITLIFVVYSMSAPVVQTMQTSSVYEQTKSLMLDIDKSVRDIASQGKGSRTSLYVTSGAGAITLYEDKDLIKWELETGSMVVSPRSMQRIGNLVAGSNLDAMAYENGTEGVYVLENARLIVHIKKVGSASAADAYNTSELLQGIYNKELSQWMDIDRLEISVDDNSTSMNGTGYTEIVEQGYSLPAAQVKAHMSSGYAYLPDYVVIFTLESGADFLTIEAEE